MSAAQSVKTYYHRFIGLGWARVFLALGILFLLLAMVSPLWSVTNGTGGDYTTTTFGWTTVTRVFYHGGVWTETRIQTYSPDAFDAPAIASSMGSSYLLIVVYLIVLIAAVVFVSLKWAERIPALGLLIMGLVFVIFGLAALLFPVFTAPPAAVLVPGFTAITGYWGSAGALSWGAGLGWWLLVLGVIFGMAGGIWPFLKSVRQPMVRPPPPREWQVER